MFVGVLEEKIICRFDSHQATFLFIFLNMLSRRLITNSSRVLMRSSINKTLTNQINSSYYFNSQIFIPQRQFSGMFTGMFEKLNKAYDVFKNGCIILSN